MHVPLKHSPGIPGRPRWGARVFGLNQTVVFMYPTGLPGTHTHPHTQTQMARCSWAAHGGRSRAEHSAPLRRPGRHTDGWMDRQRDRCISLESARTPYRFNATRGRTRTNYRQGSLVPWPVRLNYVQIRNFRTGWLVGPHFCTAHGKGGQGMKLRRCAADHQIILQQQ